MRMSVCRVYVSRVSSCWDCCTSATRGAVSPGAAEGGIAEDYHIEAAYGWWNAKPELIVNSESLGILGTDIDLINDLGIEKHRLGKFDLVLKPAKKHRFKYQRLPIKYETDAFPVQREFIFNGQRYNIGLPVTTSVDFSTYSFGYEYDFLYFPRGFVGANINMKLTNIDVDLQSPIGAEFFQQSAPIPAFGFAGRGYITKNLSVDARDHVLPHPREPRGADRRRRQLQRLRPARDLQLQQVRRRAARLAQDDDLLRGRPRYAAT